jgi:uncharacterized protein
MTITVFGATGMAGRYIVKMALWQGHTVRAYGRNVHELISEEERHDNLHLYKGGLFDKADVAKAIKGSDAVLSVLGGAFDGADKTRSLGMKHIVEAMQETGVQRIIGLGGLGVLNAPDGGYILEGENFPPQYLAVSQEHLKAFEFLNASGLQWTFICPPGITDEPVTGLYQTAVNVPAAGKGQIAAGDIADCMLKEITTGQFIGCRVGISN